MNLNQTLSIRSNIMSRKIAYIAHAARNKFEEATTLSQTECDGWNFLLWHIPEITLNVILIPVLFFSSTFSERPPSSKSLSPGISTVAAAMLIDFR